MKRGLNIYKRKDGRYEARYIKFRDSNNKPKYGYLYAKSYSEAKEKILNINNITAIPATTNKDISINNISNEWLKSVKIKSKLSTYSKYYYTVTNHIQNDIGNISMKDITTSTITEYTNTLLDKITKGKSLKAKTIRNILNIFGMVIKYYKKNYDPTVNIEITYPRCETKAIDVLNNNEIETIERHTTGDPDMRKLGILLTLYTGLRIGEICSLQWEDINLDEKYISITKTIQRLKNFEKNDGSKTKLIIDTPKSVSSTRQIPIPEFIVPLLSQYKANPKAYFLTGEYACTEPRTYQNYFKKHLKECKIRNTNFHCLRHTFATRCINSGCDVKSLSRCAKINYTSKKKSDKIKE